MQVRNPTIGVALPGVVQIPQLITRTAHPVRVHRAVILVRLVPRAGPRALLVAAAVAVVAVPKTTASVHLTATFGRGR